MPMPLDRDSRAQVEYQGCRCANDVITEGGFSPPLSSVLLLARVTVQEALSPRWPLAVPC